MKKLRIFISILLIVTLLVLALPSAAFGRSEPVGDRLSLWYGSIDFPEGSPFHIRHGWIQTSDTEAIGIFDFTLEVDGVLLGEGYKLFSAESDDLDSLTRLWVYNFPDGMTGTHTFTGHWYAPCQYAVDWLGYPGPCATPNEKVETSTRTLVANFVSNP